MGVVGRPAAGAEVEEVAGRGGVACEIEPLDEKPFVGAAWAVPALAERSAPSLTAAALSKPREGGGRRRAGGGEVKEEEEEEAPGEAPSVAAASAAPPAAPGGARLARVVSRHC